MIQILWCRFVQPNKHLISWAFKSFTLKIHNIFHEPFLYKPNLSVFDDVKRREIKIMYSRIENFCCYLVITSTFSQFDKCVQETPREREGKRIIIQLTLSEIERQKLRPASGTIKIFQMQIKYLPKKALQEEFHLFAERKWKCLQIFFFKVNNGMSDIAKKRKKHFNYLSIFFSEGW